MRKHAWLLWLGVFLPLLVLYLSTTTSNEKHLSPDPVAAAVPAWRIARFGDLDLSRHGLANPWITVREGRRTSDRSAGVVAFGVPFYALLGRDTDDVDLGVAGVAGAFAAAAAMATMALALQRLVPRRTALAATALLALGTSTWGVSADSLWPHGPDQLFLALAMLAAASGSWLVAGGVLGLGVLTRPHIAAVAAVVGTWMTLRLRTVRPVLLIGAGSALGLVAAIAWVSRNVGKADVYAGSQSTNLVHQDAGFTGNNLLGTLLSPERGLLVLCPFLLLLIPGLRRAWRVAPSWVRAFSVGGVLYLLLQSRVSHFNGGTRFWGPRLTLEPLTLWTPLLLLCWQKWTSLATWRRRAFAGLAVLAIGYQAMGAVYFTAPPLVLDSWRHNWAQELLRLGANNGVERSYGVYRPGARVIALVAVAAAAAAVALTRRAPRPAARRR